MQTVELKIVVEVDVENWSPGNYRSNSLTPLDQVGCDIIADVGRTALGPGGKVLNWEIKPSDYDEKE